MIKWKIVQLSNICKLEKGQQIDTSLLDNSKPYRYINGGIKESGYFDDFNTIGESILISEGGASCGYINYVNEKFWCGCHCYRLHDIKVFPKYLFHALKANQQRIMALRTGSAMPNIQKSTIQKFELKIHEDLTIQQNVSTILDKCNELIEKHKLALEKYDTLINSRFIEMFGDPHNNTKYPYKNVGEFTTVTSGGTPDRKNNEYWKNGKIPWVKTTELQNNELTEIEEFITQKGLDESSAKMMPKGTLLIAMYGQGKTRGMTAYLGIEASTNQACACILPSKEINQRYLWYYFILSYDKLRDLAKGGNQPNLNGNMIKSFPVLMPPIDMQNKYVSFVQQIDKSKYAVQKSLEKAETLYKSLMQECFG